MAINLDLIDQLLAEHGHRPEDITGETGLLKQLTKAVLERAIWATRSIIEPSRNLVFPEMALVKRS